MKQRFVKRNSSCRQAASLRRRYLVVALGLAAACPLAANATSFSANGFTVDISGFANAFYTVTSCSDNSVGGLALAGETLGCGGQKDRTTIGNGLLPNELITKVTTTQDGIDIGAELGLGVPIATSSAIGQNSQVDVRQAYFTLGTASFGTVKLGRDYGIFGANAILNDMTLLGTGMPVQATQRGRVSLGHIGAGYTYLGTYSQITYTSPAMSGFTFTGGVVSPVGTSLSAVAYDSRTDPQIQLQLAYSNGPFKGWIGGKTQKFYAPAGSGVQDFTMSAGEIGALVKLGGFTLLANVQAGRGLGILSDGDQGPVKGVNYLLQGTYQVTPKFKLGLSGGVDRNSNNNFFNRTYNASFKSNANITAGAYYALTKSVTLDVEISQTRSKDYLGNSEHMNGLSAGGIVFF
ncbi:MAG: porin [Rhodanobacteraceae bacterium]|nr:MAG: porin [Rhodanobacteraceae bacterium]